METAFDFLERVYLPGFMSLTSMEGDSNKAYFNFYPIEPQVTIFSERYLTPRGNHIILSQAVYCYCEELIERLGLDPNLETFREKWLKGMLKLTWLGQRFRRELGLDKKLQGRLTLTRLRTGRSPMVKMKFNLGEGAVSGDLTGVITSEPVPQMNADILRN